MQEDSNTFGTGCVKRCSLKLKKGGEEKKAGKIKGGKRKKKEGRKEEGKLSPLWFPW